MKSVLHMRKVRAHYESSTDLIQFRFSDSDGNVSAIEMSRSDAPRVLIALESQIKQFPTGKLNPARVMEITELSAAVADGIPILTIGTKTLPGLSFAIAPDQVEAIAAWLENCRSALRGQKPTTQ